MAHPDNYLPILSRCLEAITLVYYPFLGGGREEGKVEGGGGLGNRVTFIYSIYIRLKRFTEIQGVLPLLRELTYQKMKPLVNSSSNKINA